MRKITWFKGIVALLLVFSGYSATSQSTGWATDEEYEDIVSAEDYIEENPEVEDDAVDFSPSINPRVPSEIFSTLAIIFLVAFALFLIIRLYKNNQGEDRVDKKSRIRALTLEDAEENLNQRDLSHLLEKAYSARDYRSIIRLEYLQLLQNLDDANTIEWKRQKTDYMYLYELPNEELQRPFEKLIEIFQYVWYGHTEATKTEVEQALQLIAECKKSHHE